MKRTNRIGLLSGSLMALLASPAAGIAPLSDNADIVRTRGPGRTRPWITRSWCPANINRHTGLPHEHRREIARRQRQLARKGN